MAPSTVDPLPLIYRLFFHWIEPVATASGAYYAHFAQQDYINMTQLGPLGTPYPVAIPHSVALSQLANMYFVFALNEALVLRVTSDMRVWRAFLFGLLVADFGHLYACKAVGLPIYWSVGQWNAMWWGNLAFVYVGAMMRTSFLLGVGLAKKGDVKIKR